MRGHSRIAIVVLGIGGWVAPTSLCAQVVISQVYGGGGNSGAPYKNDFVELFNRGATTISLDGWSLQYASATGTFATTGVVLLNGSLTPQQYYLVQLASGANGVELPPPDASGTTALSATSGKVALVNTTTKLACNGVTVPCSPDDLAHLVDLVGYGSATFFEGNGSAPAPSNTKAVFRADSGCTDTGSNAADFATAPPSPRNTVSPLHPCYNLGDFDADGDVDLVDFGHFQACYNGPNHPPATTGCGEADFDGDNDVDSADFLKFEACFGGPNLRPACPR